MNYLKITNKNLIEAEDLYLIGSSTKRDDDTKIGMFGSGWKFALAWLMRNECLPTILSGNEKINIDFNVVLHRNMPVKVITVNGKETSLTSEMGMKWNAWMALREIVSNAIDEGDYSISTVFNPESFYGEEEKTTIFIPLTTQFAHVLTNYNNYFAFERKASWECEQGRVFFKSDKSEMIIYRKGIRCFDTTKETRIDFDFENIEINESRLTSAFEIKKQARKLFNKVDSPSVLKAVLEADVNSYLPSIPNEKTVEMLAHLKDLGEVYTSPMMQGIGGMLLMGVPTLVIPNEWYKVLAVKGIVENPFNKFMKTEGAPENFIETNDKNVSGIAYYLNGFNLNYEFFVGAFEGDVVVHKNQAYINTKFEPWDDKEIASKIIYHTSRQELINQMK